MHTDQGKQMLSLPRMVVMALLALALAFAWPTQFGGHTSYMITHGTSMEPKFHAGDFVVVRSEDHYETGDVVLYESPDLRRLVLHRIVSENSRGYILKGDNNAFNDPKPIHQDAIIGTYFASVPLSDWKVGAALIVLCLIIAIAINRERSIMPLPASLLNDNRTVSVLQACALACLVLILALPQLQKSEGRSDDLQGHGQLSYSGAADLGQTYPRGTVQSPQPVYLDLVDTIDFAYTYDLPEGVELIDSRTSMEATIEDVNGLETPLALTAITPSSKGSQMQAAGQLDLRQLDLQLDTIRRETGLTATSYIMHLRPHVIARLRTATGDEVSHDQQPDIQLRLTPGVLGPVKDLGTVATLTGTGSAGQQMVGAGPLQIKTDTARIILGLLAAVFVSLIMLLHLMPEQESLIDEFDDQLGEYEDDPEVYDDLPLYAGADPRTYLHGHEQEPV